MSKKVLVTGGSGFVGSVLVRRLLGDGFEVCLVLRENSKLWRISDLLDKVTVYYSDMQNQEELGKIFGSAKPNIIYHLATYGAYSSQSEPQKIIETNYIGTWNMLEASKNINYDLFVNTGSSSEYGAKEFSMREIDIPEPNSYYAATKVGATMLASYFSKLNKKNVVTLRPFSVYGPFEEPGRLFPTVLLSILKNIEVRLVSKDTVRDFVYIDDMVDAYMKIDELRKTPGEVFNIGSGSQTNFGQLVDVILETLDKNFAVSWGTFEQKSWDVSVWEADISKARRLLGWEPKVSLGRGVKLFYDWLAENKKLYG